MSLNFAALQGHVNENISWPPRSVGNTDFARLAESSSSHVAFVQKGPTPLEEVFSLFHFNDCLNLDGHSTGQ